jgi:hypothetical protein
MEIAALKEKSDSFNDDDEKLKPFVKSEDYQENGRPLRGPEPLIPDGTYQVKYLKAELSGECFGKNQRRLFLHFEIVGGAFTGTIIKKACKHYDKWPPMSEYYKAFTVANGGKPRKSMRMNSDVFKNKIFLVKTRTVRTNFKRKEIPAKERYSVIDEIKELMVGSIG